jgi:hypothetical protein
MTILYSLLSAQNENISDFPKVTLHDSVAIASARSINVEPFKPALSTSKPISQQNYILQIQENITLGMKSCGFMVNKEYGDLRISGTITRIDNKGIQMSMGIDVSIFTKDSVKVADIVDNVSSFNGDYKDQIRQMSDELSGRFIKVVKENRKNASSVNLNDNKGPEPERLACDLVKGKKISFCTLYYPQIKGTATIINAEIQKRTSENKFIGYKIAYGIDTVLQRFYREQTNEDIEKIPDDLLAKIKESKTDYVLLLYNFADRTPGAMKAERGGKKVNWVSNGQFQSHTINQGMADINAFTSLYCRADIFDIQTNRVVAQRDIWSDEEECGSDVVECTIDKIVEMFTVYNPKKEKNIPCWK